MHFINPMMLKESKILNKLTILVILSAIFYTSIISLYYYTKNIVGPFIFLDEPVYFNLARSIHEHFTYDGYQYNPLYPLLTSLSFFSKDITVAYDIIKLFNIIIFSSMIFPLYLICKRIFQQNILHYLIPIVVLFLPWRSAVNLIWAEPLYYTLLIWCNFLYLFYLEKKSFTRAVFLGLSLGLLFLTKQAGLVLIIAVFLAISYERIAIEKSNVNRKYNITVFSSAVSLIIPWLARNIIVQREIIGYANEISSMTNKFSIGNLIEAFIFQFSYLTLASYLFFIIIFIIRIIKIKDYEKNKQSFLVMVLLYSLGILLLAALHRMHTAIDLPFGRYTSTALPFMIIVSLQYFLDDKLKRTSIFWRGFVGIICYLITILFSPLSNSLFSYGYLNNFDLAIWNDFFIGYDQLIYTPDESINTYILPSVFLLIYLAIILVKYKRFSYTFVIVLLIFMSYAGIRSSSYVYDLSKNKTVDNDMEKYIIKSGIPEDRLFTNYDLHYSDITWFGRKLTMLSFSELDNKIIIDFGGVDTPILDGAYEVLAPWVGEAIYDSNVNKFGFDHDNVDDIDVRAIREPKIVDGMEDCIFGWKDSKFYLELIKGEYNVILHNNHDLVEFNIAYDLIVNGKYYGTFGKEDNKISLDINNLEELLTIEFVPHQDSFWSISTLEIRRKTGINNNGFYVITNQKMPYTLVYENTGLKLYYLPGD